MGNKVILDGTKLSWHRDRVEAWLKGGRIAPITIDWALTRACNQHCVFCYGVLQANDTKRMTQDVIHRFLDDAAEIGVKATSLVSDGESTVSPHLYGTIVYGKNKGLDMALGTNGSLLEPERLPEILPSLTYLRFNINAANPARYKEIHRSKDGDFEAVTRNIRRSAEIKRQHGLSTSIGLQMVLLPEFKDQVLPLTRLGRELGADYIVIKHCSDDEKGSLGVEYDKYASLTGLLQEAEALGDENYQVGVKWSKILSGGKREYSRCYGPPFIMQLSGSGLVAPCGMLFNEAYGRYHIGNIADTSFKELWKGERYWEVMNLIASEKFDARTMCGTLCLQHKCNEYLWNLKQGASELRDPEGEPPFGVNFV